MEIPLKKKILFSTSITAFLLFVFEMIGHVSYYWIKSQPLCKSNMGSFLYNQFTLNGVVEYIPNTRVSLNSSYPTKALSIDQNGFVHNGYDTPIVGSEKLIFILGGSTVEGRGASANNNTIAAYLERQLKGKYSESIRVVNARHAGYNSWQQFLKIKGKLLLEYKPFMIIELDGRNDAYYAISYANHGWRPNWQPYFDSITKDINNIINQRAGFYLVSLWQFLNRHSSTLSVMKELKSKIINTPFLHPQSEPPANSVIEVASLSLVSNHTLSSSVCEELGIKYLAFLQPILSESYKILTENEKNIMQQYNKFYIDNFYWDCLNKFYSTTKKKIQKNDFIYDFSDLFESTKEQVYWDSCHYSDRGNEIIAESLAKIIQGYLE